jgi:hypothetical protein
MLEPNEEAISIHGQFALERISMKNAIFGDHDRRERQ